MDVASNNQQYSIRPNYKHKLISPFFGNDEQPAKSYLPCLEPYRFKPAIVTRLIHQVLSEKLTGVAYNPESCSQWTREISDEVKARLKGLELSRYKFVVNVVIGEMRGEGNGMSVFMGLRYRLNGAGRIHERESLKSLAVWCFG
ncbi:Tctex1 domain-containing protein 2 [Chytriomyces hyalinus]|nr:Tctex1 domain-containing protein 2 [Chytriomyces hyalinus]